MRDRGVVRDAVISLAKDDWPVGRIAVALNVGERTVERHLQAAEAEAESVAAAASRIRRLRDGRPCARP